MSFKYHLGIADYVVVLASLFISALIGVVFRFTGGRQKSTNEYLLAGKNSNIFPVVMSTSVTMVSGIALQGTPAEIYRYGAQFTVAGISCAVGMIIASRIFVPVYFRCEVSSIYEYLEMRYGKYTRYTISAIFLAQMVLYMSVVLYATVIAMNVVTGLPTEITIVLCGSVCTFYCFLGGLKAVLWTDVFQSILMFLLIIIIFSFGINEIGGIGEIYRLSSESNRLQFFDMRFDFIKRYTFWNSIFRGMTLGLGVYGCNQIEVQRLLSMRDHKRAQLVLQWSALPVSLLKILTSVFGLVLYAIFYLCDPILMKSETGINKYDQLVPYFIITRMKSYPGLTGLCMAGIFSGTLSTMSSALNSLATVTLVDFIQPIFASKLTEKSLVCIAKGLSLLYGLVCIFLTFAIAKVDSIIQVHIAFSCLGEGTVLAIFLIGMLTRKVSDKCAMAGLVIGMFLVSWISFGSMFSGFRYPSLSLKTSGCHLNHTANGFLNSSIHSSPKGKADAYKDIFILYKISFCWISILGCVFTLCAVLIVSLLKDKNKDMISSDSKCLSPITRYWMKTESNMENHTKENGIPMK